ncbi:uncharacterized protein LOC123313201 [Coccinella septempunctata]|uniref:uncharacterized protein LOC123313185 n=1 Tax=Coccinella septempunctata TaxID=41139 RepID=UPI001D06C86C|nr:uncharacterized protein LOC123313185 [Coccinella septempunctata]XP_044753896.1 uncharacterized protein LOC123313201 [Coccinella septempunctata]
MKKYAIIVDENNEKRVVPSKWMMNNNSTLLWPPYKNTEKIRRAILQLEDPSEDWEDYQVDFIKSKDDYVEAVAEIKANLDELSGGSDAEKMKKSRARRKKISYQGLGDYSGAVADAEMKADSDVPSSESDVERIKIPKSRGKTSFFENRNKSISIDSRDSETDEHDETLKNTDENTSKSLPSSLSLCMSPQVQNGPTVADTQIDEQLNSERDILFSMHGMLKKIMTSIHALSMKQDRLEGRLRQLESRGLINNTVASVTSSFMVNDAIVKRFPIDSKEKLEIMENDLKKRNIFNDVVHFMKSKGGSSAHDLIYNILGSVVTNDLASHYSFYGQKKKGKFQELLLCSCIFFAVRTVNDKITDAEIITSIRMWLDNSKTRAERNKKNASSGRRVFSLVMPEDIQED